MPSYEGVSERGQGEVVGVACTSATSTGNQTAINTGGYDNVTVEVVSVGTVSAQAATFTIQGSDDGTNFYTAAAEQIDATASPTESVSGITHTPGNGTVRHVYAVRDHYDQITVNISANTLTGTGAGLTATVHAIPS